MHRGVSCLDSYAQRTGRLKLDLRSRWKITILAVHRSVLAFLMKLSSWFSAPWEKHYQVHLEERMSSCMVTYQTETELYASDQKLWDKSSRP